MMVYTHAHKVYSIWVVILKQSEIFTYPSPLFSWLYVYFSTFDIFLGRVDLSLAKILASHDIAKLAQGQAGRPQDKSEELLEIPWAKKNNFSRFDLQMVGIDVNYEPFQNMVKDRPKRVGTSSRLSSSKDF